MRNSFMKSRWKSKCICRSRNTLFIHRYRWWIRHIDSTRNSGRTRPFREREIPLDWQRSICVKIVPPSWVTQIFSEGSVNTNARVWISSTATIIISKHIVDRVREGPFKMRRGIFVSGKRDRYRYCEAAVCMESRDGNGVCLLCSELETSVEECVIVGTTSNDRSSLLGDKA